MKVGNDEYDLYMRVDTNTRGHRQWFYFSIKSKIKHTIKINIYRFKKHYSLFQRGMKPYVRSVKGNDDWKPGGIQVKYLKERQANENGVIKANTFYYLSFKYKFQHQEDEVFFAAGIPYTYSFLQERLLWFQNQTQQLNSSLRFTNTVVGKSTCGLDLRLLKVYHQNYENQLDPKNKRIIVINARSHSGQASSSWVLDGVIDFLINSPQNCLWLKNFHLCFYILPMLNVDGVFVGNYRTGIVGDDFNRKFASGKLQIFPQIFHLKKIISNAKKQGNLLMFMDLHGHSILKNSFIYGPSDCDFQLSLLKKLPFYLWHKSKYFKMSSCKFKTERQKIETARMYFQMKQNILSFTCQNSLGLYGTNQQSFQMTRQDWQKFGMGIIEAIKATMETEKQVFTQVMSDYNQDLCSTQIPSIKKHIKEDTKPLTAPKLLEPYKIKAKKKMQTSIKKIPNQSLGQRKNFETTISKIFHKVEYTKTETSHQGIFNIKGSSDERSLQIKAKMNEIRQRFPSLTSKQQKSKQLISGQMKVAQEGVKRKYSNCGSEQKNLKDQHWKSFVNKIKNPRSDILKQVEEMKLNNYAVQPLQKNQKKQFIESFYHKKQLKQLKQPHKQYIQLGKNLIPSSQSIRQKLQHKKNKTFIINHDTNDKIHNHTHTNGKPHNHIHTNHHNKHTYHNNHNQQNCQHKKKIEKHDISSQAQDNPFDNVKISLKDIRIQRSITYDESYLAAQILKAREMKQTQREYHEDDGVEGWVSKDEVIFQQNFSQNFDDSVNDEDSSNQDLPEQQKKYIFDYVRAHQNARRQKMMEQSSSDEEKQPQKAQDNFGSTNIFGEKKRIHGFREISFKSVCDQSQERSFTTPTNKLGIGFTTNSKIRKNPHKFQESLSVIKYKSFSRKIEPDQRQCDASEIYITHKKRLNERSLRRQSRKDPFVLVSIKDKTAGRIP